MHVHAEEQGLRIKEISPEAMTVFQQYEWPGNIRELRNLIERLMIMVPGAVIEATQAALLIASDVRVGAAVQSGALQRPIRS